MTEVMTPVVSSSISLAMFVLLQKRFRRVKLGLGGWAVEPNDPLGKLYLKILWEDGSVCLDNGDTYFEFLEKDLDFVKAKRDQKSAQDAWEFFSTNYLTGAYFFLDPFFGPSKVPENLEGYRKSFLHVTCVGKEINGLHLSKFRVPGWEYYFPTAKESQSAGWCRSLILELLKLEDAESHIKKYDADEISVIKDRVREYKQLLGVAG